MESIICTGVMVIVGFVTLTQWKKAKESGDKNRARLWMIISAVAGAVAVVTLLGALAG